MPPVVLVVTTVHPPDDPRIRDRTAGVLARCLPVRYATAEPGPRDGSDVDWVPLRGGRARRWLEALREMVRRDVGVVSVHDPELVPAALVARAVGRKVVLDVHEDVPAQIRHKDWVPRPLRGPLAALAVAVLRLAEATCTVTLAEDNYQPLFRRTHAVFPNHPLAESLPRLPVGVGGSVVYVGDVTEARGADVAVRAVAGVPGRPPIDMIGRCREPFRSQLQALARTLDVDLSLPGFLPHPEAMRRVAGGAVGVSPLMGLPNHRDSLPSKVIEYLALGLPVVASDLPGTRAVVGSLPGAVLVPPGDVAAWTRAIARALTDPDLRRRARDGAADVRRDFTWASEDLQRLYATLLEGSTRG